LYQLILDKTKVDLSASTNVKLRNSAGKISLLFKALLICCRVETYYGT